MMMGGKTYIISLPAPWIKKYGIKKGDELDVLEEGSRVVVESGKGQTLKSVKIDVSGLDSTLIYRLLHAAYIRGADHIKVSFESNSEFELVHHAATNLIGFVIVEEGKNFILIKDVHGLATEFDPIFRRVFYMLNSSITDGVEIIRQRNKELLKNLKLKDYEIGYSINFCLRYLNKRGYSDAQRNMMLYATLRSLENLGDEYYSLFKYCFEHSIEYKMIYSILTDLADMFKQYSDIFYTPEKEKLVKLISSKKKIKEKIISLSKIIPKGKTAFLGPLWAIYTRTFDMLEPKLEEAY